jgi:hypothetical protein
MSAVDDIATILDTLPDADAQRDAGYKLYACSPDAAFDLAMGIVAAHIEEGGGFDVAMPERPMSRARRGISYE